MIIDFKCYILICYSILSEQIIAIMRLLLLENKQIISSRLLAKKLESVQKRITLKINPRPPAQLVEYYIFNLPSQTHVSHIICFSHPPILILTVPIVFLNTVSGLGIPTPSFEVQKLVLHS